MTGDAMTLFRTAFTTAIRSTPAGSASATPSANALAATPSARLIAAFLRIAWPLGQMYVTFGPMARSTSSMCSNASRLPPAMTDIWPAARVAGLPETGQSRNEAPVARTRSASSTLASGAIVLISAHTAPSRRPESTPSSPPAIASIAAVFVNIVNSTSTDAASSRGVSAQAIPASSSGWAFSLVRFQPDSSCPLSSNRPAMPAPIAPRPAKPMRSISLNIAHAHLPRGAIHRFDDPEVAGAAAQVAGEGLSELVLARVRVLADECLHRHQEARRAETALKRVRLVEGTL